MNYKSYLIYTCIKSFKLNYYVSQFEHSICTETVWLSHTQIYHRVHYLNLPQITVNYYKVFSCKKRFTETLKRLRLEQLFIDNVSLFHNAMPFHINVFIPKDLTL